LLGATRAHIGFALEHGGEQVLANVLHVAELARQYEAEGGISFRGFIEELREQAEDGQAGEAPILEEGSDGVRIMTVHKAKGLEFPVVVLADITAKLSTTSASRYIDPQARTCAVRLAGCSPADLIHHEAEELMRDRAEGVRLAYVAATRARDLLVVPGVGDEAREGWIEPLNEAIYPPRETRRHQDPAPGCPEFRSKDSVLMRPNGDPADARTVCPGLHVRQPGNYSIVWWDPGALALGAEPPLGIRRSELIVKDVPPLTVDEDLARYQTWRAATTAAVQEGSAPSISVATVTQWARQPAHEADTLACPIDVVELPRDADRPLGQRFGTLVHAILETVSLAGDAEEVGRVATVQGRLMGASDAEAHAAAIAVQSVLAHPILRRATMAALRNECRREVPVTWREPSGGLIEGVIDLAF